MDKPKKVTFREMRINEITGMIKMVKSEKDINRIYHLVQRLYRYQSGNPTSSFTSAST